MGNTKKPMRVASFKLPEALDQTLTAMARERRMSRSAIVREVLEKLAGPPRVSAADLADKLIGCLDGPPDLSTNPKYRKDFGK